MKKSFHTLVSACALIAITSVYAEKPAAQWSYEGQTGPEHWGELSPEHSTCSSGKNQSPIDIDSKATIDFKQDPIALNYSMLVAEQIRNTGHSIQVDMRSGGSIKLDGMDFELKQFHFHTPSENTVNGKHFPLEAHFVHQNKAGELAVVAMMAVPGKADAALTTLWENMPMKAGEAVRLSAKALKAIESDSKFSNYYRFNGSLTTPPCTEGVRWVIMQTPITVSEEQVKKLQAALHHPNNRPVQKLNARQILE
ncbi:MAG: carbonic anhydrase family protein [Thiotrichaceae bacterium]